MTEQRQQRVEPRWAATEEGAPAVLARLRQQVTRYANVPTDTVEDDQGAGRPAPPLPLLDLPAEMQQLVRRYQKAHRTKLELIRLLSVGGPGDVGLPFVDADLPADDELVLLALTETAASSMSIEVRSQVLIARRRAL